MTPCFASCQTYEGGFSGTPGLEAHGGYTFCGLAALALLGHERLCDLDSLMVSSDKFQTFTHSGFSVLSHLYPPATSAYTPGMLDVVLRE